MSRAFTKFYIEDDSTEEFIALATTEDFDAWWRDNGGALTAMYDINQPKAFELAMNCSLVFGGGAAPRICVGFVNLPD